MGSVGARTRGSGTVSAGGLGQPGLGQVNTVPTGAQAMSANNANFSATDDGDFRDFYGGRQYYQNQTFSIDTQLAVQDYLYNNPVSGSLYSPSQIMNYKLQTGQDSSLTPQEVYMRDSLLEGMHNLGYNMNLEHYGRVDYLDSFGKLAIAQGLTSANIGSGNFQTMSEAQLKKALVGLEYSEKGFLSTSYNHFKNAPSSNPFTDKAVKINIKAPANTQSLMPGNGPGGNLGEIVLAPNQNYRITDVRFTGKRGRSGSNSYKQIEFDVEIY